MSVANSPVRLKTSQASIVPNTARPVARALARGRRRCAAATRSSCPRSTGRGRGRCARARAPRGPAAQLVAARGGAAVLPDERAVQRLAGRGVPDADRLALVGDADGLQLPGRDAGVVERLARDRLRDRPDLRGVVLDPAGLREVLRELAVGAADKRRRRRRRRGTSCRSSPGRWRGSREDPTDPRHPSPGMPRVCGTPLESPQSRLTGTRPGPACGSGCPTLTDKRLGPGHCPRWRRHTREIAPGPKTGPPRFRDAGSGRRGSRSARHGKRLRRRRRR